MSSIWTYGQNSLLALLYTGNYRIAVYRLQKAVGDIWLQTNQPREFHTCNAVFWLASFANITLALPVPTSRHKPTVICAC